jgi:uncharacterized protein YndB with AHSA1/START domain
MLGLLRKRKDLHFERTYAADRPTVWRAWTDAQTLRRWWGPDKTTVTDCEIDLRIGGTIHVVTEAGADMGRYAGTRWPMTGTFTRIDDLERLTYDARSWTEGEEDGSTIEHTNDISFGDGSAGSTTIRLHVAITAIGPKAKMAAFGMKWGYRAQLDALETLLS